MHDQRITTDAPFQTGSHFQLQLDDIPEHLSSATIANFLDRLATDRMNTALFAGEPWPLDGRYHLVRHIPLTGRGEHFPCCGCDGSFLLYPSTKRINDLLDSRPFDIDFYDSHKNRPRFDDLAILTRNYRDIAVPEFALAPVGKIEKEELGLIFQASPLQHAIRDWAKVLDAETIQRFWPRHGVVRIGKLFDRTTFYPDGDLEVFLKRLPTGRYAVDVPGYFGDERSGGGCWGESYDEHILRRYYVGAVTTPLVSIREDFLLNNETIRLLDAELAPLSPEEREYLLAELPPHLQSSEDIFSYHTGVELRRGPFPAFERK